LKAVAFKEGFVQSSVYTAQFVNEDYEGPFVTSALYYLGTPPGSGMQGKPDTLVVQFNEPVRCDEITAGAAASIFTFEDKDGLNSSADIFAGASLLSGCAGAAQTLRFILPATALISPVDDKLGAIAGALYDPYGNQTPQKPPVVIGWGRDYAVVTVAKTVFTPEDIIPEGVRGNVTGAGTPPSYGTAVHITSIKPLIQEASSAKVYDAIGNIVARDLPVYQTNGEQASYWVFWDAKNLSGRTVGPGTYLIALSLRTNDGAEKKAEEAVGVTR
jgi:hypothetical protein